jgi:hypothetical protein
MDYLYENLGDERFQEFCGAIISKEFQNIQFFPIGQPDGGRDSLAYFMNSPKKDFIVFQVKFVRNPSQERDVHKWLTETIKGEVEKINKLIPRGAKSYYLLTNVRSTGHLDVGSKDKMNKILEDNIKIPSICWWREDLSVLFEKNPIFKWSFPEILNGQDVLNSVLFENLHENKERRENVIKAYLVDQYELDNEVKFKQIDLKNRLLNLFTDVPLRIKLFNQKNKALHQTLILLSGFHRKITREEYFLADEEKNIMGAAEFLLHSKVQNEIERILLEGGPGQGKSTISQYVCQVHRVKLLNKGVDIEQLPPNIRNASIRLPFKMDLRDIAAWVEKKNPYQESITKEYFDNIWKNSLESFLVTHIHYHSKLQEFNTVDFISICKLSPVLFVFDGFDEIANLKVRSEVIEFINRGVTRISANAKSIQVIITSRPAAFSNSVGFSIEDYPHFELTDITPNIIDEYVEKWIKASSLQGRDAMEIRSLVKEKLELPHLKELAKSPMQLAIFLRLLRTKAQSLPNKRTALYDSYINLFFDRESDKNIVVRNNRDLIIGIHGYLAWLLHSEAELNKNSGSIPFEMLRRRLKEYLTKEGHDTSIADELFDVMKERVCALVSRVQGTFEFEVQPLREYFCAKYLYTTAQNSTAGSIKTGTKPDRLHAILRNNYWQNVVRFFAGCADAGELDMILQELKDLQKDTWLKYTNYPRIITSQILSDYVFNQKPHKLKEAVKIIVGDINMGRVINQDRVFLNSEPLLLPNDCGRPEIIEECFHQLQRFPNDDSSSELIAIINNNPINTFERWDEFAHKLKGSKLTKWLEYANRLQIINQIDDQSLLGILREGDNSEIVQRLQIVLNANRFGILNQAPDLKNLAFNFLLENKLQFHIYLEKSSLPSFYFLEMVLQPFLLNNIFRFPDLAISFNAYLKHYSETRSRESNSTKIISEFESVDEIDHRIHDYSMSIGRVLNSELVKFTNSIDLWDLLVENGRAIFKESWKLNIAASIAAGIKSKSETYEEYSDLNDLSVSLCKRIRCARMKSGNLNYWRNQLQNSKDLTFVLFILYSWASPKVILQLLPELSKATKSLNLDNFSSLIRGLKQIHFKSVFTKAQQTYIENEIKGKTNCDEVKYVLGQRFNDEKGEEFIFKNVRKYTGVLKKGIETKFQYLVTTFLSKPNTVSVLNEIQKIYGQVPKYERRHHRLSYGDSQITIPYGNSKTIMSDSSAFPAVLTSLAEKSCSVYANKHLQPVGKTAIDERWFEEE